MFENEDPWKPPVQESTKKLTIGHEVPELTIIDNKQAPKNHCLLQQTLPSKNAKSPINVDRLSSLDQSNFKFKTSASTSKSKLLNEPFIPDLTLLDDDDDKNGNSKKALSTKKPSDRVFTESYKEMLVNSHDHFLKQLAENSNTSEKTNQNTNRKRSPFFTTQQYKQNPLNKYAPRCDQVELTTMSNREQNANTSSILIDISKNSNDHKSLEKKMLIEDSDEVTFKKVAEMLSELQKLTISSRTSSSTMAMHYINGTDELENSHKVLGQLAKNYLNADEIIKYQIESELNELAL